MNQYFFTLLFVPLLSVTALIPLFKGLKFRVAIATVLLWVLMLAFSIMRDVYAPADIFGYIGIYNNMSGIESVINAYVGDVTFAVFLYIGRLLGLSHEIFFIALSIIYAIILFIGLKYLFQKQKYVIFSFILFALTSSFVLMFLNGLRQGLAISLFILSIGLYSRSNKVRSYLGMVLAIYAHSSVIPFVCFFVFRAYFINIKINYRIVLFVIPFFFLIGYGLIDVLALYFDKFQRSIIYDNLAYGKRLVYLKALILYIFGVIFYIYGSKYKNFSIYGYRLIFDIYLFGLIIVFSTLPVLYIASRFLYYPSALMPIMFTYLFFSHKNFLNISYRYLVYLVGMLIYGFFVYNYQSIQTQLW
jgi:hypothetical protein